MLNKPRGVISTTDDPEGRPTVLDLVPKKHFRGGRVYPVGRLDAESTGLILLTNDGELANRLTHPRYQVAKQYVVSLRGHVTAEDLEKLRRGLYLARERRPARKATVAQVRILKHEQDRQRGDRTHLAVSLREGQNRELRRMLERLGHKVRRLERVALGPLRLKGLARRQCRSLTPAEVRGLLKATKAEHE
jgi:pseudouridine synthase